MLELLTKGGACPACGGGSRRRRACAAAARLEGDDGASVEARIRRALLRDAPRERSGPAYASGFAGVLFLFGYPLVTPALSLASAAESSGLAAALMLLLSLPAPLALALALAAAVSLDGAPEKSGALPALFGYAVGLSGTVNAVLAFAVWAKL